MGRKRELGAERNGGDVGENGGKNIGDGVAVRVGGGGGVEQIGPLHAGIESRWQGREADKGRVAMAGF